MNVPAALDAELRRIVAMGPGIGGFAVRHIERDERWGHQADSAYPTASVFKVAVMVEAFRQIGEGGLALTDRWELSQEDKSTGSGVLVRLLPGLQPAVRDLITLMIIISDNTATDMLVRRLGPERITNTMRALGLRHTVVTMTCRDLIRAITPAAVGLPPHETARIGRRFPSDPDSVAYARTPENNISTANEMLELFARIHTGEGMDTIGVDAEARTTMRAILLEQQLNDRLPRFLPNTVPVAHKTGSLGGSVTVRNDAGLIDLGERGTLAIAALTRTPTPKDADPAELNAMFTAVDQQIAAFARAAYDHYTA